MSIETQEHGKWYKEFWPWFLIALLGSVVVASFFTLYLAIQHADRPLDNNSYKKTALAIELPATALARVHQLALSANLIGSAGQLRVVLQSKVGYQPIQLQLKFSHPFSPEQDFEVLLHRTKEQVYIAALPASLKGRWYITLKAPDDYWQLHASIDNIQLLYNGHPVLLGAKNG